MVAELWQFYVHPFRNFLYIYITYPPKNLKKNLAVNVVIFGLTSHRHDQVDCSGIVIQLPFLATVSKTVYVSRKVPARRCGDQFSNYPSARNPVSRKSRKTGN